MTLMRFFLGELAGDGPPWTEGMGKGRGGQGTFWAERPRTHIGHGTISAPQKGAEQQRPNGQGQTGAASGQGHGDGDGAVHQLWEIKAKGKEGRQCLWAIWHSRPPQLRSEKRCRGWPSSDDGRPVVKSLSPLRLLACPLQAPPHIAHTCTAELGSPGVPGRAPTCTIRNDLPR